MRGLNRHQAIRAVVTILYGMAMLMLPFAHRPASAAQDLSAYALPDGTIPELCLTSSGESGLPRAPHLGKVCDACLLTGAPGLINPDGSLGAPLLLLSEDLGARAAIRSGERLFITADARPRAPPQILA
jgi:hypothetical protein